MPLLAIKSTGLTKNFICSSSRAVGLRSCNRNYCFRGMRCIRQNWRSTASEVGGARCPRTWPNSVAAVCDRRTKDSSELIERRYRLQTHEPSLSSRGMRILVALFGTLIVARCAFAGSPFSTDASEAFNPPRFEVAVQTGYLLGVLGNPDSYEIGPEFLTGRIRWGVADSGWARGYNQFCLTTLLEPIFRGVENHYFGVNFGDRYNFVRPNSPFVPYFFGG